MTWRGGVPGSRSAAQPVMRRRSTSGRPRSIGMSKIHDSSLGSGRLAATRPVTSTPTAMSSAHSTASYGWPRMGRVIYDISEGRGPELRGWGRYVRCLADALGDAVVPVHARLAPGLPEIAWEQIALPRALRRRGAALVH